MIDDGAEFDPPTIDVSLLRCPDPCPRCLGRRVYRVSVPTDEWQCIENARPFPSDRGHLRDHDASEVTVLQPQESR